MVPVTKPKAVRPKAVRPKHVDHTGWGNLAIHAEHMSSSESEDEHVAWNKAVAAILQTANSPDHESDHEEDLSRPQSFHMMVNGEKEARVDRHGWIQEFM